MAVQKRSWHSQDSFLAAIKKFIGSPVESIAAPQVKFWLGLSLAIAFCLGLQSYLYATRAEYVVQDDARQHVFWLMRFYDSNLFPDDLIADYFESVAPPGYTAFYWCLAKLGLEPFAVAKVLPTVLGLITTAYCFALVMEIVPVPAVAFWGTFVVNQNLWLEDDLASATPRAFLYPLFVAFLYYLLRRKIVPCLMALVLLGLFYPQLMLVAGGVLTVRLLDWKKLHLSKDRFTWIIWGLGTMAIAVVTFSYLSGSDRFGPVVSMGEARSMLEFYQVEGYFGRAFYFHPNPLIFWVGSPRTGIIFYGIVSPLILLALTLPRIRKQPDKYPLVKLISPQIELLLQIFIASYVLYFLAHLLAFRLHFPARYIYHSVKIIISIAVGIACIAWLDGQLIRLRNHYSPMRMLVVAGISLTVIVVAIAPAAMNLTVYNQLLDQGRRPELYEYLQQQPPDTLVASLSKEGDNLPAFARRSTLVGREYALPYHTNYYKQITGRVVNLIRAQYSSDWSTVRQFIHQYGVDYLLLDENAYTPTYLYDKKWLIPFRTQLSEQLFVDASKTNSVIQKSIPNCTALSTHGVMLLEADCLLKQANS